MKRIFAAMLTALMLVTFLPLASPPARAAGVTFTVNSSVDPAQPAYVDEAIRWSFFNVSGGSGNYRYSFDVYKDGQYFDGSRWHYTDYMDYLFSSPGKYKVVAWVWDLVANKDYSQLSDTITVLASVNRITKVEPLSPTSLRITWNEVPGARNYGLLRSTDMKSWDQITVTTDTSFADTSLKPGTQYFYSLWYNRLGIQTCKFCPAASGVPMAETRITSITSPSARRIRMTWAKADGASGYQVAMATSANGSYRTVRIVTGGTTAIFSGVKSGTTLYFKVRPYRRVYTTTYWGQYSAYRSVRVK